MVNWWYVEDGWWLDMMFIMKWCVVSFYLVYEKYMELLWYLVSWCVWWWLLCELWLLNVWTCILDNAIVVEIVNVIGGVLLHWWFVREEVYSYICYVEVVHCRVLVVCPCIMIILSHMWNVRKEVFSYIGDW
jgi:hypothetical protein